LNGLGAAGEERAARFLEGLGYEILRRSFRAKTGEIDLVAKDGETLVFVEVKARTGSGFGGPVAAVTASKRMKIARTAARWLQSLRGPLPAVRFDVLAFEGETVAHLKDAFPSPIRFTF
jgi:putative endonuclease